MIELNISVGGVQVPGFSGDPSLLRDLEELVGCRLPLDYIEFLMCADGGCPELNCIQVPGDDPENIFGVNSFYSLANPCVENIQSALNSYSHLLGPHNLPIGRDGGGNQFYLMLDADPQSVWVYLLDEGGVRVKLANSFGEFVSQLHVDPDYI